MAAKVTSPEIESIDAELKEFGRQLAELPKPGRDRLESDERLSQRDRGARRPKKWVQVDLGLPYRSISVRLIPCVRPTDFRDTPGFGFPAAVSRGPCRMIRHSGR